MTYAAFKWQIKFAFYPKLVDDTQKKVVTIYIQQSYKIYNLYDDTKFKKNCVVVSQARHEHSLINLSHRQVSSK